jgi:mono/diheme cytochrome c family protein
MSKNYVAQYCVGVTALALAFMFVEIGAEVKTTSNVERGRYLVKIGGCNDCHTPGYALSAGRVDESQWLIGDRLGFQGPWGTTYPANLRRFVATLTREQWLQVARQPTRPPMPWFALRDMSDDDLAAIYDYIRALGPAGAAAPPYAPPGEKLEGPVVKFPSS